MPRKGKHNYPAKRKKAKPHSVKKHSRGKPKGGTTSVKKYDRGKKRRKRRR